MERNWAEQEVKLETVGATVAALWLTHLMETARQDSNL